MLKYWPLQQGIDLNTEVANLFFCTKQKFSYSLVNKTNNLLYIDLFDNYGKSLLFSIVLVELEILILDIVELDLSLKNIKILNYKILYDLVRNSLHHFSSNLSIIDDINLDILAKQYLEILLSENKFLLEYLLVYLIFGSSSISYNLFVFNNISTPKEHVSILLEHLIVQISNIIIFIIMDNMQSLTHITNFIHKNKFCNKAYISVRSVSLFRNSLFVQSLIYTYICQPKQIYSSRYKIFLMSSSGIVSKYIYIARQNDFILLSRLQLIFITVMEIQDLLIPQVEKSLLIFSKVILYVIINFIGNTAIFCIRMILAILK